MSIEVRRFDRSSIIVKRRDDGVIAGEAIATRAGVFKYRQPDGTIRAEFRSPAEVFKADSMASAKMVPITDLHPDAFVTPDNAKELSVGFTGENVRADGDNLVVPVNINTAQGIKAVDDGRSELSFGYTCKVDEVAGTWKGEAYTHAQSDIKYNHLALVELARAGHVASLRLDAEDAVMTMEVEEPRKESRTMTKVKLDSGLEYDCAPEVAVELDQVKTARNDAVTKSGELQKKLDAVTAERDEFKARAEKAEKTDHSEAIANGVKARLDVLCRARKVVDEETQKKLDSMGDGEIRVAVIKSKYPDLDLEGMSDDYVAARFDAIVEAAGDEQHADEGKTPAQRNADSVMGGAKDKRKDAKVDADQARLDAVEKMKARSRGEDADK
jgi:hypothetical protein